MTIVIEANVPIPAAKRGGRRESTYPFAELQPNESFWLPQPDGLETPKFMRRMSSASAAASKRHEGRKFVVRALDKDGAPGVRIWRTA
jgi:hypothetical protein